jgi:4,5-DOPA dioxygenase extradiol
MTASATSRLSDKLRPSDRMPALFVGHGSPMNAIVDTGFSRGWAEIGDALPTPAAILCVSAHWMTRGTTLVQVSEKPETIHDFGNFPRQLFEQQYPAPARRSWPRRRSSCWPSTTPKAARNGGWTMAPGRANPDVPEG